MERDDLDSELSWQYELSRPKLFYYALCLEHGMKRLVRMSSWFDDPLVQLGGLRSSFSSSENEARITDAVWHESEDIGGNSRGDAWIAEQWRVGNTIIAYVVGVQWLSYGSFEPRALGHSTGHILHSKSLRECAYPSGC